MTRILVCGGPSDPNERISPEMVAKAMRNATARKDVRIVASPAGRVISFSVLAFCMLNEHPILLVPRSKDMRDERDHARKLISMVKPDLVVVFPPNDEDNAYIIEARLSSIGVMLVSAQPEASGHPPPPPPRASGAR
jgi:hypothetical protein